MIKIAKIINDKYYTSPELAEYCVKKTKEIIGEENITEYLEPSAGSGVFLDYLDKPYFAYDIEPEKWDIIVSNPPFTNKRKIFERTLNFNKPFALIMSNTWFNDSAPKQLFIEKDLQLLMFDKRIKFLNNGIVNNKITFSSSYYCYDLLPKQIIMEKLKIG